MFLMALLSIAYQQEKNSFEKFLKWTDEKSVLADEIIFKKIYQAK